MDHTPAKGTRRASKGSKRRAFAVSGADALVWNTLLPDPYGCASGES